MFFSKMNCNNINFLQKRERGRQTDRQKRGREREGGREGPIQRVTKNIICVSFSLTYTLNLSFLKVLAMVLRNGFDSVFCKDLK